MSLFLLYLLGFFFAGILFRNSPYSRRLLLALLVAAMMAVIYFTLERFL